MKPSNFYIKIGNREVRGVLGIVLAILIVIPILALVGVILSVVFSIVGIVVTAALGVALIAIIIAFLALLIPKKWREKLGIHININHHKRKPEKPNTTPDGKPIIDVDFEEKE